ncbi:hypothetical protein L209DRAFT_760111 [Thermothelomyces heterothallicus CBS 203.75]
MLLFFFFLSFFPSFLPSFFSLYLLHFWLLSFLVRRLGEKEVGRSTRSRMDRAG